MTPLTACSFIGIDLTVMLTEICPECDGAGSIDVTAGGPSGQWTTRVHPVGFGYQKFAIGQVWEPRRHRRTRSEVCERCNGEGLIANVDDEES